MGPAACDVGEFVSEFCREVLARGVHSLSDITGKLRVHQVIMSYGS